MRKSLSQPLSPTSRPNTARYWRTRYAQLQSDFEELLAVNQTLARRNAALEGMIIINQKPHHFQKSLNEGFRVPEETYRFHQPTTKSKTIKGKKS